MDSVFHERVAGIRERVGILKDRRGEHDNRYARRDWADWLDDQRKSDHCALSIVRGYLNRTPAEGAGRE